MKRWLLLLLAIPLLLVSILAYTVSTESGLRFAINQLRHWTPGTISIEQINGRLLGPLQVKSFKYESPDSVIGVNSLDLNWHPAALFKRSVSIDKLHIDGLRYQVLRSAPKPEQPTKPFQLPEKISLPVNFQVRDVQVTDATLITGPDATPVLIDNLALATTFSNDGTADINVSIISDLLDLDGTISTELIEKYPTNGSLTWTARLPDLAEISGNTEITGSALELRINQVIAKPYGLTATAVLLNPLEKLSVSGAANIDSDTLSNVAESLPDYQLDADLRFSGTLKQATVEADLSLFDVLPEPIVVTARSTIDEDLLTIDAVKIQLTDNPLVVTAMGSVQLGKAKPTLDLILNWVDAKWPLEDGSSFASPTGKVLIGGTPDNLQISLDASAGGAGQIDGTAMIANASQIDADFNWKKLVWPADGSVLDNIDGSLKFDGTADNYALALLTQLQGPTVEKIDLRVSGNGTQETIILPSVVIHALEGTMKGVAQASWHSGVSFASSFSGSDFNPASVVPDLDGSLGISVIVSGSSPANELELQLHKLGVTGTLRNQPIALTASGRGTAASFKIDQALLESGPTSIMAQGIVGEQLDLQWSATSPDLSVLLPDVQGSINGSGRISGNATQPNLKVDLKGRSLGFQDNNLKSLDITADISSKPEGQANATILATQGRVGDVELSELRLTSTGQIGQHQIILTGRSSQGDADVKLRGSLADDKWEFTLDNLKLVYPELAPWQLKDSVSGYISSSASNLNTACLVSGKSRLCMDGASTTDGVKASYELTNLPVEYFTTFIPDTTNISGVINSKASYRQRPGEAIVSALSLQLNKGTVEVDGVESRNVRVLTMLPSKIELEATEQSVRLNGTLDLGTNGELTLNTTIDTDLTAVMDGKLTGRLSGEMNNLDFLAELVPELTSSKGQFTVDLSMGGTIASPELSGGVELKDGAVALSTPDLLLTAINASLRTSGGNKVQIEASAKSGVGEIRSNGSAAFSNAKPTLSLNISGQNFTVVNTPEARVSVSPDLRIALDGQKLQLDGKVTIPTAEITPRELPPGAIQISPDQIIVGEEKTMIEKSPLKVSGKVNIVLGDQVSVDAFGLKAKLTGDLTVRETPGIETTGTGQLDIVAGTFKAYGQDLEIQKGRVIFAGGPISQPGFDLEAVRRITSELYVGVRARGAIAKPEFTLFSDPAMTETEQLSYLVLGRPLKDNSPSENSAVQQAAMALGVAGGQLLTEKFGNKLGLDQVEIDSELRESGQEASLVVGKYLSPKLFVSYGVGLFEPVSTLRLNYSLTKNVKLVTETTESKSGGDVVFTFERGK